jgi:hypothetical protein
VHLKLGLPDLHHAERAEDQNDLKAFLDMTAAIIAPRLPRR